ncbi:pseudaminic acid synthase [Helicobacter enhydrae]|uniref:Pseudaminic acid synthase n=1 Tax=Helicobacter enhydrae TaxID=222136 RepID=A0A1B1U6Y0_9HELI|nr:pseudaminic acid synthase [Helicobacter enhydrae]ANV98481.1 pseudaminic acid synthase [Helicobacter enhydrae]
MKPCPHSPLIIAELSANHNQDLDIALQSISKAKEIGADGVKIQTYTPDCLTLNSHKEHFKIQQGLWEGQYLHALYQQAYTPLEWHAELFAYAKKLDFPIFSSPFSPKALELLESLDCPMYKVASFEMVDLELISLIAQTHKPIILSTGIATDEEITEAIEVCRQADNHDITLLKCTSAYPTPLQEAHLSSMQTFGEKWGVKYGLSDHTKGFLAPVIATSLGATMIEKHFVLHHQLQTPDSQFSLDASEFGEMITWVRQTSIALGDRAYSNTEQNPNRVFARSLFVQKPIAKGEVFTPNHITIKRPNVGLHPKFFKQILGKKATRDLEYGDPLHPQDVEL